MSTLALTIIVGIGVAVMIVNVMVNIAALCLKLSQMEDEVPPLDDDIRKRMYS